MAILKGVTVFHQGKLVALDITLGELPLGGDDTMEILVNPVPMRASRASREAFNQALSELSITIGQGPYGRQLLEYLWLVWNKRGEADAHALSSLAQDKTRNEQIDEMTIEEAVKALLQNRV